MKNLSKVEQFKFYVLAKTPNLDHSSSRWYNTQYYGSRILCSIVGNERSITLQRKSLVQAIFMLKGLKKNLESNIVCRVFRDNSGALSIANTELPE